MKAVIKKIFPGVSWQNPVINTIFKMMDPADYIVRLSRGLSNLPAYSVRVRSNGVNKQFGGQNFHRFGQQLAKHLETNANLNSQSKVLEIGCGCGRVAFALADIVDDEMYIGMDIHKVSLDACEATPVFKRKKFRFDYLDVQNDEYNPDGTSRADVYKFPYDDNEFDAIFLVSVFTHMLSDDVSNYLAEISRMLKPGGVCMITTFLMDKGQEWPGISFPHHEKHHYYYNHSLPEKAVGYYLEFYESTFAKHGAKLSREPLWGDWRQDPRVTSTSNFGQDIVFFKKE